MSNVGCVVNDFFGMNLNAELYKVVQCLLLDLSVLVTPKKLMWFTNATCTSEP